METELFKTVASIAGIGGVALLVFYFLMKDIIGKNIFTGLSREQSYNFLKLLLLAIWSAMVIGVAAYVYVGKKPEPSPNTTLPSNERVQSSVTPILANANTPHKPSPPSNSTVTEKPSPNSPIQAPLPRRGNITTRNTAENMGNGQWRWMVFLTTDSETLSEIDCVEYTLHPTFPNPEQRICTPGNNFAFTATGWGTFEIIVRVIFKDGTEKRLTHMLRFT